MDIRCRKGLCKYNDRFTCKANKVLVDGEVVCSTYERDMEKRTKKMQLPYIALTLSQNKRILYEAKKASYR